ncbi:MAG: hypothetical protein HQM08_15605 [Candidatus Riflebacteria bacterium]|nr:hypothetical protein [Candidatus Riflebacteria bacterium]
MNFGDHSTSITRSRQGVVLILVAICVLVMFLTGSYLLRSASLHKGQTNRLGEMNVTSGVGQALAQLALHKIMNDELANPSSQLTSVLSQPLSSMNDFLLDPFPLDSGTPSLKSVFDALVEPLKDLGNYSIKVSVKCSKSDFSNIGLSNIYPREKMGLIHILVNINYRKFNTSLAFTSENYHYVVKVKITAALVPILSKFTLYVENAQEGDPWRFNVVSTDQDGRLVSGSGGIPIVLDNAADANVPNAMPDFVRKPTGFVYLGGGPIYLNLARGWGANPDYGEGFHLFESGKGDGLYTVGWGKDNMAILHWDQGTCQPSSSGGNKDWYDFVIQSPLAELAKLNSAFRLYGTDIKKSPTLVFGEVFRSFVCAKAYKSTTKPPPFPPAFLPYIGSLGVWTAAVGSSTPSEGFPPVQPFFTRVDDFSAGQSFLEHLKIYQEKYASNIVASQPFNLSLAFIGTNNRNAFPRETHFRAGDPLLELTQANPPPSADKMHALPNDLSGVIPGVNSLRNMQAILEGMKIPGDRVSWVIPASQNGDVIKALTDRGLAYGASPIKLNCNGWIYVEGDAKLDIKDSIEIESNGGIVLERGTINISSPISQASGNPKVLYLVTKDGNIKVGADVQAPLIAGNGKITFSGAKRKITGALAMSKFDISNASVGADISYNPALAALPMPIQSSVPTASEASLLSYSICPDLILVP